MFCSSWMRIHLKVPLIKADSLIAGKDIRLLDKNLA